MTDIKTSQIERFFRRKEWKGHKSETEDTARAHSSVKQHDPLRSNRRWWEQAIDQETVLQ